MIEGGKVILMMSEANREIRMMEAEASERRRQPTARTALHRLDRLIEELEEMNLSDQGDLPESFLEEFSQLRDVLPSAWLQSGWPTSVIAALDRCFELQERLFAGGGLSRHVA
jgi:hypothetical protein